ncbi:Sucrose nonfermenting 4-like protein [Vitis vinifera]|uniref:Sucrose nonfermenting 4-like protein n=1 Tax=Vitis vinifera TaxID=29760 RepID=A0A438EZT0_VITVI|nr:Sucrose nonfermenting 4-like protein [Vitis vinifera]
MWDICEVNAGPYDSLKDVTLKILQNKVATVPIIHSASQDGSFPQLLHLASLSGILKCICRHFRHSSSSLPILQQPICSIPVGTWVPKIGESNGQPFAMLRPNASLGAALSLLVQGELSLLSAGCRPDPACLEQTPTTAPPSWNMEHFSETYLSQITQ